MRRYRIAPIIWSVGLTLASVASFTRMTSDEHFFTDVLAGAAVGSAVGVFVPWQLHRPRPFELTATRTGDARGFAVAGRF